MEQLQEENGFNLRWFTPMDEVDLCGHATLASAHILWTEGFVANGEEIYFQTKSGVLTAKQVEDFIELNFPIEPAESCEAPAFLVEGLGVTPEYVGKNRMDYIVEVDCEATLLNLKPNFAVLARVGGRGIIVTSKAEAEKYDFVSRCFYPAVGVNEDPVTGSAHCCLGPYWQKKLHKTKFKAMQISARGGVLFLDIRDERILIAGLAITTLQGSFLG
jgi:PhzF family phenazine biosynthesis protein